LASTTSTASSTRSPTTALTRAGHCAPGGASVIREGEFVYCPWHQWGFELATGTTAVKPEWSIRTYPVQVVDHKVIITA